MPSTASNPFLDPTVVDNGQDVSFAVNSTLAVGRDATLTMGTDALIVLDEDFEKESAANCCGLITKTANTRSIPFYNILWASIGELQISIQYAHPSSKTVVRALHLTYAIDPSQVERAQHWIARLLDRSYKESQQRKRVLVLVNPHAGKGGAVKQYNRDVEPILQAAQCTFEMVTTKYRGQAGELMETLDVDKYDVVAVCSGDGLCYEVFNGLGKRRDAKKALTKLAVCMIPCGSGNAMAHNMLGTGSVSMATLGIVKGIATPLDLISVTQGDTRTLSFLSQALGIVAESDLATEHLRFLGDQRFTYGFLVRMFGKVCYPADIAVKVAIGNKEDIKEFYRKERTNFEPASERRGYKHLLDDDASAVSGNDEGLPPLRYGTINDKLPEGWELIPHDKLGNFYVGNLSYMAANANFFQGALPNDGHMDMLCIDGDVGVKKQMQMMLSIETNKLFEMPGVTYKKVLGYRIIPKNQNDGYISIDGERVPFQPFQAEVHKGLGTVLTKSGHMFEAPGF